MNETHSITGLKRVDFQKTVDGKPTDLFILTNCNGLEMTVTNYGAKIVSLSVPDKNGKPVDVVTGHGSIDEYLSSEEPYFGAVCGRTGNRIAKGTFTLDGKTYTLAINNGPNNLHGGLKGFNAVVWDARQPDRRTLVLTYLSKDGEEGFPGNLTTTVTYKLTDDDAVQIDYRATTDRATIVNLTNHSYFNLSGAGDPYVGDHLLQINADTYLPTDETAIPYGQPETVEGTPMDFRQPTAIGLRINDHFRQLVFGKGYDHTYVLNKDGNERSFCAKVKSPKTGIIMDIYTTEPGVQLYTGNWMTGSFVAKNGQRYPQRSALCLETQHFPDSINHPEYPSVVLRPGEVFESQTIFQFSK
ncbi:MAG: galactose mutarotase [Dysgonamonadaceae bacterium]|jgi:aldose 1-epimerase|nr:galactose mutarotase [Dysgonamonadaceae bacterium]